MDKNVKSEDCRAFNSWLTRGGDWVTDLSFSVVWKHFKLQQSSFIFCFRPLSSDPPFLLYTLPQTGSLRSTSVWISLILCAVTAWLISFVLFKTELISTSHRFVSKYSDAVSIQESSHVISDARSSRGFLSPWWRNTIGLIYSAPVKYLSVVI